MAFIEMTRVLQAALQVASHKMAQPQSLKNPILNLTLTLSTLLTLCLSLTLNYDQKANIANFDVVAGPSSGNRSALPQDKIHPKKTTCERDRKGDRETERESDE